ncbi:histidine phosphatase family protein [Candidatus Kaiserbacteria bacterium]|nr:histidine phosphatase family protein [Candidatus Kaiserbacteria bacterium]
MKTIYIVRHGETAGNKGKFFQTPDTPLSDEGRKQAEYMAERAAKLSIECIVASTMDRANETARIISKKIGVPVESTDLLRERILPKEQRGKPMDDAGQLQITQEVTEHFGEPGWRYSDEETFEDLRARTDTVLKMLEERKENTILVVTHGVFQRLLLARLLLGSALTPEACEHVLETSLTTNTGLTVLRYGFEEHKGYYSSAKNGWQLLVWNDHAHLG